MAKILYSKVNLPEAQIKQWDEKVESHVKKVERLNKVSTKELYRLTFNGLNANGYILAENGVGCFFHYCEANEQKKSCVHTAVTVALAKRIGLSVERISIGMDPTSLSSMFGMHKDEDYEEINSNVGLLNTVVEEPEVKKEEEPVSSSTPSPVPSPTTRNWKIGWNEKQEHLEKQGADIRLIGEVQEYLKSTCNSVDYLAIFREPTRPKDLYEGPMLTRALRKIFNGRDLFLVGEGGTGKDTLVETLAWLLGLPFLVRGGKVSDTEQNIVGDTGFKNNETTFEPLGFTKMAETGGIYHLSEINMLPGDVTTLFHPYLDNNRIVDTPNGQIKRHQHSIFVASFNRGDGYAGVKPLNDALKSRVALLELETPPDFKGLIQRTTGLTNIHALTFLEKVRDAINSLIIDEGQGHSAAIYRNFEHAAKDLAKYGVSKEIKTEVLEDYFINKVDDLAEQMAVRDIIRQKAWKEFPKSKKEEAFINGGGC